MSTYYYSISDSNKTDDDIKTLCDDLYDKLIDIDKNGTSERTFEIMDYTPRSIQMVGADNKPIHMAYQELTQKTTVSSTSAFNSLVVPTAFRIKCCEEKTITASIKGVAATVSNAGIRVMKA